MGSQKHFVFDGVMDGETVRVSTEAWQSGQDGLPEELQVTAQEKVLTALLAVKADRNLTIDELNTTMKEKGELKILAVSPPICWNPSITIVRKL